MQKKIDQIDIENMQKMQRHHNLMMAKLNAEMQIIELQQQNAVLSLYVKYGLSEKDQVNWETGEVASEIQEDFPIEHYEEEVQKLKKEIEERKTKSSANSILKSEDERIIKELKEEIMNELKGTK